MCHTLSLRSSCVAFASFVLHPDLGAVAADIKIKCNIFQLRTMKMHERDIPYAIALTLVIITALATCMSRRSVRLMIRPMGRCIQRRRPMLGYCAHCTLQLLLLLFGFMFAQAIRALSLYVRWPRSYTQSLEHDGIVCSKWKTEKSRERKKICEKQTEYKLARMRIKRIARAVC